jgi:hypothetical protein
MTMRTWGCRAAAVLVFLSGGAHALEFDSGVLAGELSGSVTVGAAMRAQDRSPKIIGKTNLPGQQELCVADDCVSASGDPAPNQRFVEADGFYSVNGDDGNLNFDKGDLVSAVSKLSTDLTFDLGGLATGLLRGAAFFDQVHARGNERHFNTLYQPAETQARDERREVAGADALLLDAYVHANVPLGGREAGVRIGKQVLNWGESTLLVANSLNSINPPNLPLLRLPGADLKEVFVPVPLAVVSMDLFEGLNAQAFYQLGWEPVVVDPAGTFYSTSDLVGGGSYAMLSFAKAPEDPAGIGVPAGLTDLLSDASRALMRTGDRLPSDGGQYGLALRQFLPDLLNGTEIAGYFMNYHSRFPIASFVAAQASSCRDDMTGVPLPPALLNYQTVLACGGAADDPAGATAALLSYLAGSPTPFPGEALPVDSAQVFLEYPENIRLYGLSFNASLGDFGIQGEVAYRENLPLQVHQVDLVFAALQPAFPAQDVDVAGQATLPGARSAVPDYVETAYRGHVVQPGDYIRGFERMKAAQLNFGGTNTLGAGSNPLGADQILTIFELGWVHVPDLPSLDALQLNGPGTDTHYSPGADGTGTADGVPDPRRQNPTRQVDGFPTANSWGYRIISMLSYNDAFAGVNVGPLLGIFHDVQGISPGPGGLFVEGTKQFIGGLRFDYMSKLGSELRYVWYTGGAEHNQLRDRDVLQLSLNYAF